MQFNFIAKYYTFISRLAFGSALEIAKTSMYRKLPKNAKVLFIGGGSGVSLSYLVKQQPSLNIDYVDESIEMIRLAKSRVAQQGVSFICNAFEDHMDIGYDVIITEFFFDLFAVSQIEEQIAFIKNKLNKNGVWVDTDFRSSNHLGNKVVIKLMYLFFRVVSSVKVSSLVDYTSIRKANGFMLSKENVFKSGFITSRLFVQTQSHLPSE